ncbi:MAG: glutamate--cysteine ligase [Dermatophilus congolensis]|nr:glutamate--cysteine ligase [Dermatophilus congolensis]
MGREVSSAEWDYSRPQEYREKVQLNLDVFDRMLVSGRFAAETPMTGVEMELDIIGSDGRPQYRNAEIIEALDDPEVVPELAKFNLEVNVKPRLLRGDALEQLHEDLVAALQRANEVSQRFDATVIPIGILPTLEPKHLEGDWMTTATRFKGLNDAIMRARGEDVVLDISGPSGEWLRLGWPSIAPEAACTSFQLHLQVTPMEFAPVWNAAQALAGVQVAIGANSPFFFGKELWHESRIPVFTQAVDTRPAELVNQGVRPRVHFGETWITSIYDLFEDNVRHFPSLLPEVSDEDPVEIFESYDAPELPELTLHNGTIYRWNRPIYDNAGGRPHLRVENRVLPAGPTVADMVANAAFFFGTVHAFARESRPIWTKMSFAAAENNFVRGAKEGYDARFFWPGVGRICPDELVLQHLLEVADSGLRDLGASDKTRSTYLGIIEERALARASGAAWQIAATQAFEAQGMDRTEALAAMTLAYTANAREGAPVHEWAIPTPGETTD